MWIRRCIEVDLNPLYSLQRKDSDSRSVLNDDHCNLHSSEYIPKKSQ